MCLKRETILCNVFVITQPGVGSILTMVPKTWFLIHQANMRQPIFARGWGTGGTFQLSSDPSGQLSWTTRAGA